MTSIADEVDNAPPAMQMRRLCCYIATMPDLDLLSVDEALRYCGEGTDVSLSQEKKRGEEQKRRVRYLSFAAMRNRGVSSETKEKQPHLSKYLSWMSRQISVNSYWDLGEPLDQDSSLKDHDILEKLCVQIEYLDAEGKAIAVVARSLPSILDGQAEGLQVLFDDSSLMDNYYRYAHSSVAFSKLRKYFDARVHKDPGLTILEVGAGIGGATEVLLGSSMAQSMTRSSIPRFAEYTYTDISPSFFEQARTKFSHVSGEMTFTTLNIEVDPRKQGYLEGQYDMIIASHVLHATKSLKQTLRNVRLLLNPGGTLILYETVTPQAILPGYIFGLLPGWWLSDENDRIWSPLYSEASWDECLRNTGFSGVALSLKNNNDFSHRGGCALIATAVDNSDQTTKTDQELQVALIT